MGLVYIVRHGNTFDKGDIVTRVGGRTDIPLSSSGVGQAQALGEHFKAYNFARAYCSSLQRTRQTAEAITSPVKTLDFLTEIDYGPDENKPEANVIARLGGKAIQAWDRDAIIPDGWKVKPDQIKADWTDFLAAHANLSEDTLLVTSNGTARFLFDVTDQTGAFERKLKTGAYGVIDYLNGYPVITAWNIRPD